MNVVDYLRHWADRDPTRPLFAFIGRNCEILNSYTYGAFDERTDRLARALDEQFGIGVGEPVLLAYPPGLEMIAAFFACAKAGALPVPVPPPTSATAAAGRSRIAVVCASAGATRVLTDAAVMSSVASDGHHHERYAQRAGPAEWIATNDLDAPPGRYADRSRALLFLQYTSGSTQQPRGVMVSHDNVIANCFGTVDHIPVGISWLPHFHDMGLIGFHLYPLIHGGSAVHFAPAEFLRRPGLWLTAISRFRGTITSAPNFAYEYCLRADKVSDAAIAALDLSTLRTALNGAEEVQPHTMTRFRERFARAGLRPDVVVGAYGLAENTLCATRGGSTDIRVNRRLLQRGEVHVMRSPTARRNTAHLASSGKPIDGVDVRIVTPDEGCEVQAGQVGEVWIAGSSKAQGYWGEPESSARTFSARLENDESGAEFLRTGDLGFFHDEELYLCGRLKDIVIVQGRNIYPSDIESFVEKAVPQAARVVVFGLTGGEPDTDGLVVLLECRRGEPLPDLGVLHRHVQAHVQAPIRTIACVARGSLARTSSGKITRVQCQQLWTNGKLPVLAQFESSIRTGSPIDLPAYCDYLVELAGGSLAATLGDLGLDSFELVTLSLEVERYIERKFPKATVSNELFDLRTAQAFTVGQLQQLVNGIEAGRMGRWAASNVYRKVARTAAADEATIMRQDTILPASIRAARGFPARDEAGTAIFVTGGTGFLGAYLVEALLRLTTRKIVVLVRAPDASAARRRMAMALRRTGVEAPSGSDDLPPRVDALAGDITAPRLGLSDDDWRTVTTEVGTVFHSGAEVDYVKPYSALRPPNVLGTQEVLTLCATGAPKTLHYVSTTFVFGWSPAPRVSEDDFNESMYGLDFGYSQSKWVAEQLVHAAAGRGIATRIYRPAFLTASRSADYVREDLLARAFSYMIRHGVGVNAANELSMLPVDVAAQNIVAIALLDDPGGRVFHLTTDTYATVQRACERITEHYGYRFTYVDIHAMIEHLNRFCGPDDVLFPLVAFFRNNSHKIDRMRDKRYDNRQYRSARGKTPHAVAEPSLATTVGAIVEFLRRQRLIPAFGEHVRSTAAR